MLLCNASRPRDVPLWFSEEIAHPSVTHHLSQLSVDIQLSGLIKFREDPGGYPMNPLL